jgi:hypothetical protein
MKARAMRDFPSMKEYAVGNQRRTLIPRICDIRMQTSSAGQGLGSITIECRASGGQQQSVPRDRSLPVGQDWVGSDKLVLMEDRIDGWLVP